MQRIKEFIKTSLLGGVVVILPVTIFFFVLRWIFNFITDLIQPLTNLVVITSKFHEIFADLIVIAIIIIMCFAVGIVVRTKLGSFLYHSFEEKILKVAPGYSLIKETILQFLGTKKSPFSQVALVRAFGDDILVTAFITDSHDDGSYTVFVPTAPTPMSGLVLHVPAYRVHPLKVSVEATMRSIISCGIGSKKLMDIYLKNLESTPHKS